MENGQAKCVTKNHSPSDAASEGNIYPAIVSKGNTCSMSRLTENYLPATRRRRDRLPAIRLYKQPLTSDTESQGTTYPVTQRYNRENRNFDYISVRVNYW